MSRFPLLLFLVPAAYQVLAIVAALKHLVRRPARFDDIVEWPGVSVLKPVQGLDPNTARAFLSQVEQDYPKFEVLFGVREESDQTLEAIRNLQDRYPNRAIRLVVGAHKAANPKVGTLMSLAEQAQYPVWVVNDGDIEVKPQYLKTVVGPLADRSIALVTCLYRAQGHTVPSSWVFSISSSFFGDIDLDRVTP